MTMYTRRRENDTEVGRIVTSLTVTNRVDQANAARGILAPAQVRTVQLDNVLVDTGATTLCLPPDVIAQLGLELARVVQVSTATGVRKARVFQDAKVSLLDRTGTFECLELPGGQTALLGVLPLEAMGIELDLQNQSLRTLPITGPDTYLTIMQAI